LWSFVGARSIAKELERLLYWRQGRDGQVTRDGSRAGPDLRVRFLFRSQFDIPHVGRKAFNPNRVYVVEFVDEAMLILDGGNLLSPHEIRARGFEYHRFGGPD
jgi:hypothetical protein